MGGFVPKSLNSFVKLQQMFKIAEIELGMENTIGITLETGVGVQSAILHGNRCRSSERYTTRLPKSNMFITP